MRPVMLGNVGLGEGRPKICVPIACEKENDIIAEAYKLHSFKAADIVEWRADWYAEEDDLKNIIPMIRSALDGKPLIFTFRSKKEGGQKDISKSEYIRLLTYVIENKMADCVDAEYNMGEETVREIIKSAKKNNVPVIVSYHDFHKTDSCEEIMKIMKNMVSYGADICKTAVMPDNKLDVIELMKASVMFNEMYPDVPVITMSMGKEGVISRMCGNFTGSVMTFGTAGQSSAPGQPDAITLKHIIEQIQECV